MKNRKTGVASALLGLTMLASSVFPISSVFARTPGSGEKVFGTDPFSLEYSKGTVFWAEGAKKMTKEFSKDLADSLCPDGITPMGSEEAKAAFCYNNHARDNDVYYIVRNGAVMNNEPLDVLVYAWSEEGYWGTYTDGMAQIGFPSKAQTGVDNYITGGTDTKETVKVFLEFHFYEAGTAGKSGAKEVNFKGVIGTSDLDDKEGFYITQGYKQGYVGNPTDLTYTAPSTWTGTANTSSGTIFRAEVESTPAKPLKIDYIVRTGLGTNLWSHTKEVTYNIKNGDGFKKVATETVAQYGLYQPLTGNDGVGTIDKWYTDEEMTKRAGDEFMVYDNVDLYGEYVVEEKPAKTPNTGANSEDENLASSNSANLLAISGISLISLSGIILATRIYRRNRISKF